jgi:hypothetical protein
LVLRFLAFGTAVVASVMIISQQASSFVALFFLLLIPGALLCVSSALSVFELFYAHRKNRDA